MKFLGLRTKLISYNNRGLGTADCLIHRKTVNLRRIIAIKPCPFCGARTIPLMVGILKMEKENIKGMVGPPNPNLSDNRVLHNRPSLWHESIRAPTTWQDLGSHNPTSNTIQSLARHLNTNTILNNHRPRMQIHLRQDKEAHTNHDKPLARRHNKPHHNIPLSYFCD